MADFTRTNDTVALTPDDHGDIWYAPLRQASVALQVGTEIRTSGATYRTPVVLADPTADWGTEGAEITSSDPTVTEVSTRPERLAGLTVVSRELLDDSNGQAEAIVTSGLIADVARRIDEAAFGAPSSANAPDGLRDASNVQNVATDDWDNLDPFSEAQSLTETTGRRITGWVANPATALALSTLKESTGSNRNLLQPDATAPTGRAVLGVPMFVSEYVEDDVVWGIPIGAFHVVLRTPAELSISTDAYFSSYSVGIRVVQRVGMVVPHEPAIVKITAAASA